MSIELDKMVKKVGIILEKKEINTPPTARVGLALDVSGSTSGMYRDGVFQKVTDRLLAVAMTFDDNGSMDMWAFDTGVTVLEEATTNNFEGYVNNNVVPLVGGGTIYSPAFEAIVGRYYGVEKVKKTGGFFGLGGKKEVVLEVPSDVAIPALVFFVTDGANERSDNATAEEIIKQAQKHDLYWVMVGVGPKSNFRFIEQLAGDYPNVGFLNFNDLNMTEDKLYESIFTDELIAWLKSINK